ncbi:hypothetical protein E2C01_031397 [Portunus trituberculatus]|uniref:Uncharacterized protein n=1 Tax=Portunus trituberculatus TaxID=210409 RepID=A0A5B7EUE8_PORTR|nr:hypothetical protein [Portunus trituberculatus]
MMEDPPAYSIIREERGGRKELSENGTKKKKKQAGGTRKAPFIMASSPASQRQGVLTIVT